MKKIFFLVLLVSIGMIFLITTKDREEKKIVKEIKENSGIKTNQDKLYVSVVKKMDQEDTNKVIDCVYKKVEEFNSFDINNVVEDIKKNDDEQTENKLEDTLEIEEVKDENTANNLIISEENSDKELIDEFNKETEESNQTNNELNDKINEEEINIHYLKNGFYEEYGNTYYYENDNKVTGLKVIDGVNNYFSPSGKYLGISKVKVIDVSYYQKDINWDLFASDSDCYGVILRLGYFTTLDSKFERNINELKRLNIPYGIYLFSYATNIESARKEAIFTNNMIDKYDIKPTLGIYYDLESWKTNSSSSDKITKNGYNYIAKGYVESVSNHVNNNYNVGVYSGRWYAMNRFGKIAKSYVNWVAEYNSTLKYDGPYLMWQYTSKGNVPGIDGNVDISYLY